MPRNFRDSCNRQKLGYGRQPVHGYDTHQPERDEATPAVSLAEKAPRRNNHYEAADDEEKVDPGVAVVPWLQVGAEVVVQKQGTVKADDEQGSNGPQALNGSELLRGRIPRCGVHRIHLGSPAVTRQRVRSGSKAASKQSGRACRTRRTFWPMKRR